MHSFKMCLLSTYCVLDRWAKCVPSSLRCDTYNILEEVKLIVVKQLSVYNRRCKKVYNRRWVTLSC